MTKLSRQQRKVSITMPEEMASLVHHLAKINNVTTDVIVLSLSAAHINYLKAQQAEERKLQETAEALAADAALAAVDAEVPDAKL